MIPHPALLSLLALDLAALAVLAPAARVAVSVVLAWAPGSASRAQLDLERQAERASLLARFGVVLFLVATLLQVAAVASVLPGVVPGAMCGTGVLQAAGRGGVRALAFRGLALALLLAWRLLDGLDRSAPRSPLAPAAARALLVAAPVAVLAVLDGAWAFAGIEGQRTVDCCAAIYDTVAGAAVVTPAGGGPARVALLAALTAVLAALGATLAASDRARRSRAVPVLAAAGALAWAALAAVTLVDDLAPYHFGVLGHRCPWCLFQARHGAVGYPLLALAVVAVADGVGALLAREAAARCPDAAPAARRRQRAAGVRLAVASVLFLGLAAAPLVAWRLRHGVLLDG